MDNVEGQNVEKVIQKYCLKMSTQLAEEQEKEIIQSEDQDNNNYLMMIFSGSKGKPSTWYTI